MIISEYIVIISDIAEVSCDVHQNENNLGVPVRGYATCYSKRVGGFDSAVQYRARTSQLDKDLWRNPLLGGSGSNSTLIEMP